MSWAIVAVLIVGALAVAVFFVLRVRTVRLRREKEAADRRESEKEAAFLRAALEADRIWMQETENAIVAALKSGDTPQYERLSNKKAERVRRGNEDMQGYLREYYSHLRMFSHLFR